MNRRIFVLLILVLPALGPNLDVAPATQPETARETDIAREISVAIVRLGDDDGKVRDAASSKLLSIGKAAQPALREATRGDDPEVAARAGHLLAEMRFGIDGDTPAALVDLVQEYRNEQGNERSQTIQKMSKLGWPGFRVMARLHRLESDLASRRLLLTAMRGSSGRVLEDVRKILVQGKEDDAQQKLSEAAIGGDGASIRSYAALLLSRKKLTEAIQGVLADTGPSPGADDAMLLAYLYRAGGDAAAAVKWAQQVPEGDLKPQARELVRSIRIERGEWAAMLSDVTRIAQTATDSPTAMPRTTAIVDKLSYARLAGDDKAFDEALDGIRGLDFGLSRRDMLGIDLIINDRVKEGLDMLVAGGGYQTAYTILIIQGREDDAAAVLRSAEESSSQDKVHVQLFAARQFANWGEKSADEILDRVDKEVVQDEPDENWRDLIQTELILGHTDRAIERAVSALSAADADANAPGAQDRVRKVMGGLVPPLDELAREWRVYLSEQIPDASKTQILKRIWMLFAKKMPPAQAEAFLRDAAAAPEHDPVKRAHIYERNIVTARAIGRDDIATDMFTKWADDEAAAQYDLGVLWGWQGFRASVARDYSHACTYYGRAHERWPNDAIVWWMHGWTAVQAAAGDSKAEESGREEMRRARETLMANDDRWINFLNQIMQAGVERTGDGETQRAYYRRFGTPGSPDYFESLRLTGTAPIYPDPADADPRLYLPELAGNVSAAQIMKAADLSAIALLMLSRGHTVYWYPESNIRQPAKCHAMRARALIATGDMPSAMKEIDLALALTPASWELASYVVPALDRAGHGTDADAIFDRVASVLQGGLDRHPRSAYLHSIFARMCAACDRRLDQALEHANQAVSLAPDNVEWLNTLAEVQFYRGQRQAAIETVKHGIELDPGFADFRRQLKRFSQDKPASRPG